MKRNGRPGEWQICPACSGSGGSSAYLGSFTASEFAEAFDPDEQEEYFNGGYDRTCDPCRGSGKVWIDTGPHLTEEELPEEFEVCPCGDCEAKREHDKREERRMQWIESGCPDGHFE